MKEFSEILKELRVNNNLTQEALGDIVHVSRSAIAKYENGLGIPSAEVIELLCKYFKVTKEELFPKEEVEHLIVEKNKKIKLFKLLLIIIVSLVTAFLGYTIYFYINEAVNNKRELEERIEYVKKYENIESYEVELIDMYFEDNDYSNLLYYQKEDAFFVESGTRIIIELSLNKYLAESVGILSVKFSNIDQKVIVDVIDRVIYEDNAILKCEFYEPVGDFSQMQTLKIESVSYWYSYPTLNENNYIENNHYEKISFIDANTKNNELNYYIYNRKSKIMNLYFYDECIATINFDNGMNLKQVLEDEENIYNKYLFERINNFYDSLCVDYNLIFSNEYTFIVSDNKPLDFPRYSNFDLIIKPKLENEIILEDVDSINYEVNLNDNIRMSGNRDFLLNGNPINDIDVVIRAVDNNVCVKKRVNYRGDRAVEYEIKGQKIGTAQIEIEVDLSFYKFVVYKKIEVLPFCKVYFDNLGYFVFPWIEEIGDFYTNEIKEEKLKKYNEVYLNTRGKVIDLFRPNEYEFHPIFEEYTDFQKPTFIYNYKIKFEDTIEISPISDSIHINFIINDEDIEKYGINNNMISYSNEGLIKDEESFFDGKEVSLNEPGVYRYYIIRYYFHILEQDENTMKLQFAYKYYAECTIIVK